MLSLIKTVLCGVIGVGLSLSVAGCQGGGDSAREIARIDWKEMQESGNVKRKLLTADEGEKYGHALKIESPLQELSKEGSPTAVTIVEMKAPKIGQQVFTLSGWVRYDKIEGPAYLEMWTVFPNGTSYFTRTLADSGPMGQFRGTSDWRRIELPFQMDAGPNAARPKELILNACFKGPGTLWVSELKVTESSRPFSSAGGGFLGIWGWIPVVGGVVLGLIGAVMGVSFSLNISPRVLMPFTVGLMVLGGILMMGGIAAVSLRQPYVVWYPLMMEGCVSLVMGFTMFARFRTHSAELEMRRMQAMDLET